MSLATFFWLWSLVFHSYLHPDHPSNSTTNATYNENSLSTTPGYGIIKPAKPTYPTTGLITGTGNGTNFGDMDNDDDISSEVDGSNTLVLNPDEISTTTEESEIIPSTNPNSSDSSEYDQVYYKRWECLWHEKFCDRAPAQRYCTKGCLLKYNTLKSDCFDGCCRCLIFTLEAPSGINFQSENDE